MAETIGVAIMMGGGPSVVYGTEALTAFDVFASTTDEDGDRAFANGSEEIRRRG